VDYAARVACEIGADIVKLNEPNGTPQAPPNFQALRHARIRRSRRLAQSREVRRRTLVLVSGGSKMGDDDTVHKARVAMEAGCVGLIFGRNMWQRKWITP